MLTSTNSFKANVEMWKYGNVEMMCDVLIFRSFKANVEMWKYGNVEMYATSSFSAHFQIFTFSHFHIFTLVNGFIPNVKWNIN